MTQERRIEKEIKAQEKRISEKRRIVNKKDVEMNVLPESDQIYLTTVLKEPPKVMAPSLSKEISYADLGLLGFKCTKSDKNGDHFNSRKQEYKDIRVIADYRGFTIVHKKPWYLTQPHTIGERMELTKFVPVTATFKELKAAIDQIIAENNWHIG
jgi:hypothetical protein